MTAEPPPSPPDCGQTLPYRWVALTAVLIAGAARELDAALIVNPYDPDRVAQALDRALGMWVEERRERHAVLMRALRRNDIRHWCARFIETLTARKARPHARALTAVLD